MNLNTNLKQGSENQRYERARRVQRPALLTLDRKRDDQGVDHKHYTEHTGAASNLSAAVIGVLPGSPTPARIGTPQYFARELGGDSLRWDGAEPRRHTRPLRQNALFR